MTNTKARLWLGLALASFGSVAAADGSCPVMSSWLSTPSMPTEVAQSAGPGNSTFCDFYQFSTQAYLYLMSKSAGGQRNFLDPSQYAVLEFNSQGNPANSCDATVSGTTLRKGLNKTGSGNTSISTQQAGDGATIYAQDGNVIYYDVRFNKALCNLSGSAVELQKKNITNFPGGTTEIKAAWKVLSAAEISGGSFVTQQQSIGGQTQTLGLVGMHIAIATPNHPEFVWATFEHEKNSPDCAPALISASSQWTFASQSCASGLTGTAAPGSVCNFNNPSENLTAPTGTPTNICRVYPFGTGSGDLKAAENISDISQQNSGLDSLLGGTSVPAGMGVLKNYFNVGALWVSDTGQSSGGQGVPNERGSLRLANSVAETTFQQVNLNSTFASNCFGCHNYVGSKTTVSNNITSQNLSHAFLDIVVGQGKPVDVTSTTVIPNNGAAQGICQGTAANPGVCPNAGSNLKWNGQWTNINSSAGSVCGCVAQ